MLTFDMQKNTTQEATLFTQRKYLLTGLFPDIWTQTGCELKSDKLYLKGFTKVIIADGNDMTGKFPKFEERKVRANNL